MSFVSIEGLDGSGKSTVLDAITDEYPDTVTTSEPSEHEYGQLVRRNLSDETSDPLVDFLLFMADRRDHISKDIIPALNNELPVVSDRYSDSTRAYQPVSLTETGVFESQMHAKTYIEQVMSPWNLEPDVTLYIDVSVDTALERCGKSEKYEQRNFLEQVKQNYNALAESDVHGMRIARINGEQSKEAVREAALDELEYVL